MAGQGGTIGGGHVQAYALSKCGNISGPWQQQRPLVRDDSGHGMLFHTFDDQLMMASYRSASCRYGSGRQGPADRIGLTPRAFGRYPQAPQEVREFWERIDTEISS